MNRQKIEAEAREQLRKLTWLRPGPIVDRHRTPWIEGNVSGLADWAERLVDEAVGEEKKALLEIIYSIPLSGEIHSASSRGFRNRLRAAIDAWERQR